jgi:L-histidine Nalpha-methyltransferase
MSAPVSLRRDWPEVDHFRDDVLAGLSGKAKSIPPRYFYDARGAAYFEAICDLPEYYPTRCERAILQDNATAIAAAIGPGADLVEFGAGNLAKARIVLAALDDPVSFTAVDISTGQLRAATDALGRDHPGLTVIAVGADFLHGFALPRAARTGRRRVAMFLGSSIGNLTPDEAEVFLRDLGAVVGQGGGVMVGVDLVKDTQVLHAAYNDAAGVTASFNLNLLDRINRELGGDFNRADFEHRAFYDPHLQRIEMHLVSSRAQAATVAGQVFSFSAGETIHTENSYKYTIDGFRDLARRSGLRPVEFWTDAGGYFSVHYFESA